MQTNSQDWKEIQESVLANAEFSLLDVSSATLREKLETQLSSINASISNEENEFRAARGREATAQEELRRHRSLHWDIAFCGMLALTAALALWHRTWWIPLVALALFSVGIYSLYRVLFNRKHLNLRLKYEQLKRAANSSRMTLREALSSAMVVELRALTTALKTQAWHEDDLTMLPSSKLVESDATELYLAVKAQDNVGRFITGQTTGAIGIAGPRGVGKTTLLRNLVNNPPALPESPGGGLAFLNLFGFGLRWPGRGDHYTPLCCFVSAPVRYDFRDFFLHLYATICRSVLPADDQRSSSRTYRRSGFGPLLIIAGGLALTSMLLIIFSTDALPDRSRRLGLTVGVASIFVALALMPFVRRLLAPGLTWDRRLCGLVSLGLLAAGSYYCYVALDQSKVSTVNHLRAAGIASAVISLAGFFICGVLWIFGTLFWRLLSEISPLPGGSAPARRQQVTVEAARRLDAITYQQTIATTVGAALKGPGGLQGNVQRQSTRSERPKPLPELVREFRDFIHILTGDDTGFGRRQGPYVMIAIDELDKIESTDAAAEFINELKSMFRLPRCYFLVSVSLDVLRSYSRSGAPLRDAFDSAFDTVEPMSYWPVHDCARLLDLRVKGMSRLAEVFCYAHSGGLPRDLIRVARRIAGEAGGAAADSTLPALIWPLLQVDIDGQLEAALGQEDKTSGQATPAPVPLFAEAVRTVLHDHRRVSVICQQFRQSLLPLGTGQSLSDGTVPSNVLSGVYLLATLGEVFCSDSTRPMRTESVNRDAFIRALEQLARARQTLQGHPETAWAAIREARLQLGLPVEPIMALDDWRDSVSYL